VTVAGCAGWGFDAHRFGGSGPVLLAGVVADSTRGLKATSDGDVVAHALGDLGALFPSDDPRWAGADSMQLLEIVNEQCSIAGLTVSHLDVTVIAEKVRVAPIRDEIRARLASSLHLDPGCVSIKATSTDGMGFTGRDEGMAAVAVAVGERPVPSTR
jgi:2-C-methyl-D-erythritol 2,4-cyclodiphosphate synthase